MTPEGNDRRFEPMNCELAQVDVQKRPQLLEYNSVMISKGSFVVAELAIDGASGPVRTHQVFEQLIFGLKNGVAAP